MTELMKRYWNETGKDAITFSNMATHFTDDYVAWLELQNLLLKLQLTWRPVSEKPEKKDIYFAEVKPYTGCESTIITTAYFDGKRFPWHDVVKWLPIPPAPEGEWP